MGIEYLKALIRTESTISPVTFQRKHAQYHDRDIEHNIASATAIRESLRLSGLGLQVRQALPQPCLEVIQSSMARGEGPIFLEDLEQLILGNLRMMTLEEVGSIMDVEEGLENRIRRFASDYGNIDKVLEMITTRRYVSTRIQRILINSLLNNTTAKIREYIQGGGPQYIRILGFRRDARPLMAQLKNRAKLPIITKSAHVQKSQNRLLKEMFMTDVLATDLYVLTMEDRESRVGGQDYKTPPLIL